MSGPVLETKYGLVRGLDEEGVRAFRGVPYGRAPAGKLRFRPPRPPEPWAGVRTADSFGLIAPQPVPARPIFADEPREWGEDCLSLNVWTPALDGSRRPVMVWIHGGSFVSGSAAGAPFRGHLLARGGDVVVVSINYRLGAFGWLAHPDLRDEDSGAAGNWGLLDQVAALQWVGDHAEALGGDPSNITVFGVSAGGMCLSALLGIRRPAGLFHRAIMQSGGPVTRSLEAAAATAERLLCEVGLSGEPMRRLRDVPAGVVLEAQTRLIGRGVVHELPFAPVVDGVVIDRRPTEGVAGGRAGAVAVLAGTNLDEMTYFAMGDRSLLTLDENGLRSRLHAALGEATDAAIDTYRSLRVERGDDLSPVRLWCAIQTDWAFRIPTLRLLEAHSGGASGTYAYLFSWKSPAAGGILGACHGLEVPFVFGTLTDPVIAPFTGGGHDALRLSVGMQRSWTGFARSGDASSDVLGTWARYEPGRRTTMVLGPDSHLEDAPLEDERRFWERLP